MLRNVPSSHRRKWLPPRTVRPRPGRQLMQVLAEGLGQRREDLAVRPGDVVRAERRRSRVTGEQPGRHELGEHDELGLVGHRLLDDRRQMAREALEAGLGAELELDGGDPQRRHRAVPLAAVRSAATSRRCTLPVLALRGSRSTLTISAGTL